MVRTAFPDLSFTLDLAFESGDLVTGRWTMSGTHTGPMAMLGLPPTGRPVTMTGQEIFRAAEGRFVEVWHQEDVPGMLTQLGLQPQRRSSGWRPGAVPANTGEPDAARQPERQSHPPGIRRATWPAR